MMPKRNKRKYARKVKIVLKVHNVLILYNNHKTMIYTDRDLLNDVRIP